jgi:hypothetical protein
VKALRIRAQAKDAKMRRDIASFAAHDNGRRTIGSQFLKRRKRRDMNEVLSKLAILSPIQKLALLTFLRVR